MYKKIQKKRLYRLSKTFIIFLIKPAYLLLGKFLFKNTTWSHIRKHCFNFPGKNFHIEIRKKSEILFHLNKAYNYYFEFKYRNLSSREWQKLHWDDYGFSYYSARNIVEADENFLMNFKDMVKNTSTVLEIGCGGFVLTKQLAENYSNIIFHTYDISDESLRIYEKDIKPNFNNINFKKCSIFDNLKIIDEVSFIYTYHVFMHFNESDINDFFSYLKKINHQVFLILQEPYTENIMSFNYKHRDYQHNYISYFEKFGFRLIDFNKTGNNFGIFYFVTK
jgi:2-polyprenyl-3-methyl-5-hydroxy-6-metoxy-1,4-benzoquinol methylase